MIRSRPDPSRAGAPGPGGAGWCLLLALALTSPVSGVYGAPDEEPRPAAQRLASEAQEPLPTIEEKTRGTRHLDGFFDLYWDPDSGKLFLEIDRWQEEFLYQVSLATGLGSNPVGLDRGQLGGTHVVEARRVGPRVLLVQTNYDYRARTTDAAEARAVREAFAPSTLWGFEAVAETGQRVLVDATEFFLRDAHGVARQLEQRGQGDFQLVADRSVIHLPRTRAFPENTEVESWLTFTSDDPGDLVRRTAATGEAVSIRQHHSLVRLPDTRGYRPRPVDPRVGAFGITFRDYATSIDEELEVRWAARHRLERRDFSSDRSAPAEPVVYYVDPGIPEPIRSAVIQGASWWEEAFRAAGYEDAFRVEVLPDHADPMDLRYNVIHWTHRRTRGWSYGSAVIDPRTGEILKGNVNLGSLRLRQDRLLGRGLRPGYAGSGPAGNRWSRAMPHRRRTPEPTGGGGPRGGRCDLAAGPGFSYLTAVAQGATPTEMALARIRQLAAHEVGHTLGLAHNYIASTRGRASVMDYPAPLVRIREDSALDLSDAYDVGIGEYDAFAINWLYRDFPTSADEAAALDSIVRDGLRRHIRFISDADARPAGAAHPLAALWDNGADPAAYLNHEYRVRRLGLQALGPSSVAPGEPLATLEEILVPLYLHHRYQLEAAAHTLGGVDYSYALRGDGQTPVTVVSPARQRQALEAMLHSLSPRFLALPEGLLEEIPPRAFGMASGETFAHRTAPTFDPLGVAASAARFTLRFLLQPERMARLVDQHRRDTDAPGLEEVLDRLLDATWRSSPPEDPYRAAVGQTVQRVVLDGLLREASSSGNTALVRARLFEAAGELQGWLRDLDSRTPHQEVALEDLRRWRSRPHDAREPARIHDLPPGSPIGESGGG